MANYYDIDDILAEEEVNIKIAVLILLSLSSLLFWFWKFHWILLTFYIFFYQTKRKMVPAVFQQAADGVGLLDSSDDTNKVITVETWLAIVIKSYQLELLTFIFPIISGRSWFKSRITLLARSWSTCKRSRFSWCSPILQESVRLTKPLVDALYQFNLFLIYQVHFVKQNERVFVLV